MSDKLLSVMSEMVTKVCEQSKEIEQLKAALAKKQEEVEALHDVWWQAYNCFPQSWVDMMEHLIDDKGVIDIEAAKVLAEKLRNKGGLEPVETVDALVALWDTMTEKFPAKWDHLQYDLRDKHGDVDIKTVQHITHSAEHTDSLR